MQASDSSSYGPNPSPFRPSAAGTPSKGGVAALLAKFQAQAGSPGSPSPSSPSNLTASSPLFAQAGSSGSPPTLTTAGSGAVERERRLRGLERSESVSKRVSSGPWAQAAGAQSASSSPSSGRPSLDGVSSRVAAAGLGLGLPSAVAAAEGSGQQPSTISPSSRPRRASSKSVLGDRRVSDELERLLGAKVGGGPVAAGGSERVGEAPAGASSSNRSRASPSPETVASPCASFDGRRNFDASSSSPAPIVSAASIAVSSNAREGNGLQLDRPDEGETSSPTLDVHKNDSHESRASTDPAERPSSPAPEYRVAIEVVPPTPVDPARPRSPAQDATAGALEIVVDSKAEKRSMAFEDGETTEEPQGQETHSTDSVPAQIKVESGSFPTTSAGPSALDPGAGDVSSTGDGRSTSPIRSPKEVSPVATPSSPTAATVDQCPPSSPTSSSATQSTSKRLLTRGDVQLSGSAAPGYMRPTSAFAHRQTRRSAGLSSGASTPGKATTTSPVARVAASLTQRAGTASSRQSAAPSSSSSRPSARPAPASSSPPARSAILLATRSRPSTPASSTSRRVASPTAGRPDASSSPSTSSATATPSRTVLRPSNKLSPQAQLDASTSRLLQPTASTLAKSKARVGSPEGSRTVTVGTPMKGPQGPRVSNSSGSPLGRQTT